MTVFGPEYSKIQTAFKRDARNIIIPGDWTLPEFIYLKDNEWQWTEKVDGTNIRLHWDGSCVAIGGRTDSAQTPATLIHALAAQTDPAMWRAIFPNADDVTVYGEGYGARIQKGGMYRPDQAVIVFDVRVGMWWLRDGDVLDVATRLGLETVPSMGTSSLADAWHAIQCGYLESHWPGARIEGIVGRPAVDLCTRSGERLQVKLKVKDWQDYVRRNPGAAPG